MKKHSSITFVISLAFLFFLAFGVNFTGVVVAGTSNVTVDVNITSISEITVSPSAINWTQLTPGTAGGNRLLDIKNTGSVNVTNVYAYISTLTNESSRPYGSSNPASYSAGGVLLFHNNSDSAFYWAGRIEWNWTSTINNFVWPSAIDAGSRVSEGFFRNASNSYVWGIGNGTGGFCNDTNTKFAITDVIDDGTTATRSPDDTGIENPDGFGADYSYFSVGRATSFLNGMCVAIDKSCTKIYVYKYDKRTSTGTNFNTCLNSQFIIGNIIPNEIEQITADVWVPTGLPAGDLKQAIWTFVAS